MHTVSATRRCRFLSSVTTRETQQPHSQTVQREWQQRTCCCCCFLIRPFKLADPSLSNGSSSDVRRAADSCRTAAAGLNALVGSAASRGSCWWRGCWWRDCWWRDCWWRSCWFGLRISLSPAPPTSPSVSLSLDLYARCRCLSFGVFHISI